MTWLSEVCAATVIVSNCRSAVNRYAEPEAALSTGADHHRPAHQFRKPELDVGVGKPRLPRTVHFHRREIDPALDQRGARRPEPDRRRQTRVPTPPRYFRQVERPPTFVNRWKSRRPPT